MFSVMKTKTVNRLFVYGTLAPGEANAHFLQAVGGCWQPATVRGVLFPQGIGLTIGYPALRLDASGPLVQGLLFTSPRLANHWSMLDEFEGEGYRRCLTPVRLRGGALLPAWVYALNENPGEG